MSPAESERWVTAGALLDELLTLDPEARERSAQTLGAEHGVSDELRSLLEGLARDSVLDSSLDDIMGELPVAQVQRNALQGQSFGPWVLGEEIGRGGMSVVYLATRKGEGFEQRAACKLLSIALYDQQHLDAFLRERQILSELEHPSIARMIDGGVSDDGIPYLIMEYVEGEPVDRWCRSQAADVATILRLMHQVSLAVAHAQRHLVVHRDIGPANVLVDHRGNPKLLDFGIASLLDERRSGGTIKAFTPAFAAPEQRLGNPVTTATDVYGLGALLRHLLADKSRNRDLDLVVQVATHDDPLQRYPNARALSDDLQRLMEGRPVAARADSLAYRASRFLGRHKAAAVATTAALVLVSISAVMAWKQSQSSAAEAQKRQVVADFMLDLFAQADLMRSGADLKVTDLLATAMTQADAELAANPESLVALLTLIASGQTELMNYEAAETALSRAGEVLETDRFAPALQAEWEIERGRLAYELGNFDSAVQFTDSARSRLEGRPQDRDLYLAAGATQVSYLVDAYRNADALELAEQLMEHARDEGVSDDTRTMLAHRYAVALEVNDRLDEAFAQYEFALESQRAAHPTHLMGRASILADYGIALYFASRFEEAESASREVLAVYREHFEPPHPRISSTLSNVAYSLVKQGRDAEALPMLREAIAMSTSLHGPDHLDTLSDKAGLAVTLAAAGELSEAEALLRENLAKIQTLAPELHIRLGIVHSYLGDVLLEQGELVEAKLHLEEALGLFGELPPEHQRVQSVQEKLATISVRLDALLGQGPEN